MYRCLACSARFESHYTVCNACFCSHSLVAEGVRPRAEVDGEMELVDATTLARATWQRIDVPAYPSIELRRGALVVLFGPPGAGKSSMLARALDTLNGPALLVSVEEPAGPSLAMRLGRLGVKRNDLYVAGRATVDQIASFARERRLLGLGIDSVQRGAFEPRDLRHLLLTLPHLATMLVSSQVNKQGDLRGSEELRHEADVVIEVSALRWAIVKSRYQMVGANGAVLREVGDAAE